MDQDFAFQAEYAKSNRASCKGCKMSIGKDSLRLAVMVQSPHFDGKIPNWYHFKCFWKKARVKNYLEIGKFDDLRWDDQEKIKEKISGSSQDNASHASSSSVESTRYKDYSIEYAKSNRSTCKGCGTKIDKNMIRISRLEFDSLHAKMHGPVPQWYHTACFKEKRCELEFGAECDVTLVQGFNQLKKEDKFLVKKEIPLDRLKRKLSAQHSIKSDEPGEKRLKMEDATLTEKLKTQNESLWQLRDSLSKDVSSNALKGLLEYNKQAVPSGEAALCQRVADAMLFGRLAPCPECSGQLVFSASGYHCTGMATEWSKCLYSTQQPKRKKFGVPEEYKDVPFLKSYKYVKQERLFPKEAPVSHEPALLSSAAVAADSAALPDKPLRGMSFSVAGKRGFVQPPKALETALRAMGATIVSKVGPRTAAVITSLEEFGANELNKRIREAKSADVHVVDENFVAQVTKGGVVQLITNHAISDWGSDPLSRIVDRSNAKSVGQSTSKILSSKASDHFTKHVPNKLKLQVKGGAAVDPDSHLETKAHLLSGADGEPYNCVLQAVDLLRDMNSFYKLQVLEADSGTGWWVFRAWGRVGTTIGGNKLEKFSSKAGAIEHFSELYLEKSGNNWLMRKSFIKIKNKFYPVEMDYSASGEDIKCLDLSKSSSKLPTATQDLIRYIFDIESMKSTLLEMEIDLNKMPLGKLSKKQIEKAFAVLTELQELTETGAGVSKFLDASTRFYTLIPHDFGMNKAPLLDTKEAIKNKTDMLNDLLDIEVAYSLLKTGASDMALDPLDASYAHLKTKLEPLLHDSEEFQMLSQYVDNTHGPTHLGYKLTVQDIFKVEREGEAKRFKGFRKLPNHHLLWHGSRRTNWAGILSQGLRIAPPEAPSTGYMFGKGIYFADMVTKSANYCFPQRSCPHGLLMLSQVALGECWEHLEAHYVKKLPPGKHSVKGVGSWVPDPKEYCTTADGVVVPCGKPISVPVDGASLLYNEYIIYDTAQCLSRYLFKVNFDYK